MVELGKAPFNLGEKQQEWVKATLDQMTLEEKAGQLFLVIGQSDDDEVILEMYRKYRFGGIMYRPDHADKLKKRNDKLQAEAKIPVLIAANLEAGGSGAVLEGTNFASQLEAAATGDVRQAYRLGYQCQRRECSGRESGFCPCV